MTTAVDCAIAGAGPGDLPAIAELLRTAEKFFAARGLRVAVRSEAPEVIRRTGQYSGGCGCSAVRLTRERRGAP